MNSEPSVAYEVRGRTYPENVGCMRPSGIYFCSDGSAKGVA